MLVEVDVLVDLELTGDEERRDEGFLRKLFILHPVRLKRRPLGLSEQQQLRC